MRRVPIRMKLAGALVIPLAALVVVTTLEVLDSLSQARDVHLQADLATSAIGPPSLLSRIEDERNAAAIQLLGLGDAVALPVEDNAEARANTDDVARDARRGPQRPQRRRGRRLRRAAGGHERARRDPGRDRRQHRGRFNSSNLTFAIGRLRRLLRADGRHVRCQPAGHGQHQGHAAAPRRRAHRPERPPDRHAGPPGPRRPRVRPRRRQRGQRAGGDAPARRPARPAAPQREPDQGQGRGRLPAAGRRAVRERAGQDVPRPDRPGDRRRQPQHHGGGRQRGGRRPRDLRLHGLPRRGERPAAVRRRRHRARRPTPTWSATWPWPSPPCWRPSS